MIEPPRYVDVHLFSGGLFSCFLDIKKKKIIYR